MRVRPGAAGARARLALAGVALASLAATAVVTARAEVSDALFSDAEHAAGTLTARTVAPPVPNGCQNAALGFSVIVRWTLPAGESGVAYEFRSPSNVVVASGTLGASATSYEYNKGLALTGAYTWRLWTVVPGTAWTSAERSGVAEIGALLGTSSCAWNP